MSDDLTQAPTPSPSDEPATAPSAPADTGYEIGVEIARGGMGTIHRGRDRALDREVAIKILQDRYPIGSSTARRFVDEARITGQLQHPGIPPIHHVGTLPDGRPFLAMKLVKGRTLDEILKERDGTNRLGGVRSGLPGGRLRARAPRDPPRPEAGERDGRELP